MVKKIIVDIKDISEVRKNKNIELKELIKILEFAFADVKDPILVQIDQIEELVDKYRYKPE